MIAEITGGRAWVAAALLSLTVAGGALGQGRLTVSKGTGEDAAMFTTIQAAVNAAKPGQVIEILDASVYEEQVTIDGRDASPWTGVVGGKNGITIRYAPTGARLFGNNARPTIKYKDMTNTHPRNQSEAGLDNELTGAVNYETCGALRILWAQGVTIDGIKIDGGGLAPFGSAGVFEGLYPLFHGNAAVAVVASGGASIRNCDIANGYFGVYVKDRNTGGVFANPNPADGGNAVPLSGFGKTGGHLFEYNKIHANMTGMFFESSYDLGATVRYNLIYSNIHNSSLVANIPGGDGINVVGGAILFQDMMYTPVAIYNNTFFNNSGNILGGWKIGASHLIFNNIFGKPNYAVGAAPAAVVNAMFEHRFPYRMHNSVFAAAGDLRSETRYISGCSNGTIAGQQISGITQVRISNGIPSPPAGPTQVNCVGELAGTTATTSEFIAPGALLTGTVFDASANIRWLETTRSVSGTEDLFVSTDSSSADFLMPKWDHPLVAQFIKNKGWTAIGIRNSDGSIADIGAIPSTGRAPSTVARIKPSNIVLVTGTTAKASFFVTVENGELSNAKISFLRWVAPLPTEPAEPAGSAAPPVPSANIRPLTPPSTPVTVNGNNTFTFTVPAALSPMTEYGFFEIAVSGIDANGNTVASDVGFLLYRRVEHSFKIDVLNANGGTAVTDVTAGQTYRLRVTPLKGTAAFTDGALKGVSFSLLSDAAASIRTAGASDAPLDYDANVPAAGKEYSVYFTRAGNETIFASGVYEGGGESVIFAGAADIVVKPGAADRVTFLSPIPLSQLGNAPATIINRGVDFDVKVAVQDMYGNAVDVATPVSIVSNDLKIGDAGAPGAIATKTVTTDKNTGVATFIARVTNGTTGQTFDMTASIAANNASDVGRLRLGRALDRLEVFYSDTGAWGYDPDAKIEGNVGDWFKVTVRVLVSDTVNTNQTSPKVVRVSSDNNGLIFSATSGGTEATDFPLNRGVATFWVSGNTNVLDACIDVVALTSVGGELDGSISPGNRCAVSFVKPSSSIINAVVYGDGHGRPDSLLIRYAEGGAKLTDEGMKPDKATLTWPTTADGVEMTASGAALTVRSDYLLHVNLAGASLSNGSQRPAGYTSIAGLGRGLVKVYNGGVIDDGFDVIDGVGPVIAVDGEADGGSPVIIENSSPGIRPDTLLITVSEQIRDPAKLKGAALLYTKDANPTNEPGASGGTPLNVIDAYLFGATTYQIVVTPVAGGLAEGDWIRFDPSSGVTDRAAWDNIIADNKPHPANRWARLKLQEVAPSVIDAWYTSNNVTGKPDYAYVKFDKTVSLADWFSDGSVNFDKSDIVNVATAGLASLFSASGDTLKIDLSVAFKSSQAGIRTSEDMPFTLGYASNKKMEWDGVTSAYVQAKDKAAPVLAGNVNLITGSLRDDGASYPDTIEVTYSERPSEAALSFDRPVTILTGGGGCEPVLKLLGQVVPVGGSSRFYKATYLVEGDLTMQCPAFPENGDEVSINAGAMLGDDRTPPNVQDAADNLRQPLRVFRGGGAPGDTVVNLGISIRNNPLTRGGAERMELEVSTGTSRPVGAEIAIYDNRGNIVASRSISDRGSILYTWNGRDRKGRLVSAGSYLLEAKIVIDGGGTEKITLSRVVGVVPGSANSGIESVSGAPAGFTAGANPVKAHGGVGFFWDGAVVKGAALSVYDASGRPVRKIAVGAEPEGASGKRGIGAWDLTDGRGRAVAEGSYVVKGTVTFKDGKKKRVSAIIGVGR